MRKSSIIMRQTENEETHRKQKNRLFGSPERRASRHDNCLQSEKVLQNVRYGENGRNYDMKSTKEPFPVSKWTILGLRNCRNHHWIETFQILGQTICHYSFGSSQWGFFLFHLPWSRSKFSLCCQCVIINYIIMQLLLGDVHFQPLKNIRLQVSATVIMPNCKADMQARQSSDKQTDLWGSQHHSGL